jgi:foldase protein PrsA
MKICSKCGEQINDASDICYNCGAKVKVIQAAAGGQESAGDPGPRKKIDKWVIILPTVLMLLIAATLYFFVFAAPPAAMPPAVADRSENLTSQEPAVTKENAQPAEPSAQSAEPSASVSDQTVVAVVNGENIYKSEAEASYEDTVSYYSDYYGMTEDSLTDDQISEIMNDALDSLILDKIQAQKAKQLGFTNLSQADQDEVKNTVGEDLQSLKDEIRSQVEEDAKTDVNLDVEQEVAKRYSDYLAEAGYTEQSYLQLMIEQKAQENLMASIEDKITVSDQEVRKWYDDNLKSQREEIEATPSSYEEFESQGDAMYVPQGVIRVWHILIKVPDDKSQTAMDLYNQDKKEDAMNMLRPYLDKIKPKAEEVLAKVQAGEDFAKLMDEYNEDEGLQSEPAKSEGYTVVPGNDTFLSEFTDAALKLKNTGDTSGLVETPYGYHIIKNIGVVSPGAVPFDQAKDIAKEESLAEKKDSAWQDQLDAWKSEVKIELYKDRLSDK